MKIAMIAIRDEYGLYAHTSHLIKELSRMSEIELHVINLIDETNEATKIDKFSDFTIHYVNQSRSKIGFIRGILNIISIREKILEVNPEILHMQYVVQLSPIGILLKSKYPIVCTIHSLYAMDEKMFEWVNLSRCIYRKILSLLERTIILKSLPNIIVVAPPTKDLLVDKTNATIYTIPNGIDLKDVQDITPKSIEHPAILYVGRLTKRKGVDVLLKAIPIIKTSIPNPSLYVMGAGQQEDELKRFVKELNIEENVKFLGFVSEEEKYSYYKSVDVCIVPSVDYDYAPVVLPEEMACEKPIVASNVGGIPFMVEDGKTGLLVKPGNVEELAEKIIMLLQNENMREKMGKAGNEKIKNFTWDKIAQQTVEVYKGVIKDYEGRKGKKHHKNRL